MDLKLWYILILWHIMLVIADLVPSSNPRKYCFSLFDDHEKLFDNNYYYCEESYYVSEELNSYSEGSRNPDNWSGSDEANTYILKKCPDGKSSITEDDLLSMIKYFEDDIKLVDSINETYFDFAVTVRDNHIKNFKDFLAIFDEKPKHLKHVLEDLTEKRKRDIEPILNEIASKLPEIALVNDQYQQKLNDSSVYFKKLEKYKKICELNCDTSVELLSARRKRTTEEKNGEIYCDTLEHVKNKITNALLDFKENFTQYLHNSTVELNETYDSKMKGLKSQFREAAVKEFGMTMYDVLSLTDEYNHYLHLLTNTKAIYNIKDRLSNIRKTLLQIDLKIEDFKDGVEIYRKKCLDCGNRRFQRDVMQENMVSPYEPADMLERLLQVSNSQIENIFKEEQDNLFEYLNNMFNNTDKIIKKEFTKLQPIHDDIKIYLKEEEQEFENLKNQAPEALLQNITKLSFNSNMLLSKLNAALDFIHQNV